MPRQPTPHLESLDAKATVRVAVSEKPVAVVNPVTKLLESKRPPITAPDSATTKAGQPVWIAPTLNDRDPEGGRLKIDAIGRGCGVRAGRRGIDHRATRTGGTFQVPSRTEGSFSRG
jgi:hypothetical protein